MVLMPGLKGKYDAWNRLVEVRDSNDNLIAQYEYNGLNQRIKKTVGTTVTKSFFNENWQEVESVTNEQITSYVWGLRYIDDLILREKDEERLYSLADPNWNVVAICDATGNIQERYTYDVFGKRKVFDENFTAKTDTEFNWNRAFTGQVLDSETGLMLYRERYYDVVFGRFISCDPLEYWTGDINLYRYVLNSPSIFCDSYGLEPSVHYLGHGQYSYGENPAFYSYGKWQFKISNGKIIRTRTVTKIEIITDSCGNITYNTSTAQETVTEIKPIIKPPIRTKPIPLPKPLPTIPGQSRPGTIGVEGIWKF
jgi:RHS repeat-associated protein